MQHEISSNIDLLDAKGNVLEPVYPKKVLFNYDRSIIKAKFIRIQKWDCYCILNEYFDMALTIADNAYMGLDAIILFDFDTRTETSKSFIQWLTFRGKTFEFTLK